MSTSNTMRAMAAEGSELVPVAVPVPACGPGQVRVTVSSAAVNAAEDKVRARGFVGRFLHKYVEPLIIGWDFAGTVDTLGEGVTAFAVGDAVWGHLAYATTQTQGTYAEYIRIDVDELAVRPPEVPEHVAAAAATCAMTSLQALRDYGRLPQGGSVLVIGAGGGVGELAVGIAKRLGAHVTGVCSAKDVDRVGAAGADTVIDRAAADPFAATSAYDVVFDTPAVHSFGRCAKLLKPGGSYVTTLPGGALVAGMVRSLFTSKRCRFVQVVSRRADLELVGEWLSDGLAVTIDSRHPVAALGEALARQAARDRVGRVVVDVAGGWPS